MSAILVDPSRHTDSRGSKIENFIRTKYDSKRWVMDGPMPDPATLGGEGDDDVVRTHLATDDGVVDIRLTTKRAAS